MLASFAKVLSVRVLAETRYCVLFLYSYKAKVLPVRRSCNLNQLLDFLFLPSSLHCELPHPSIAGYDGLLPGHAPASTA